MWTLADCNGTRRYIYNPDSRYQLRQVWNSLRTWCVWALYLGEQRIHEVHALSRVGFVKADALEYIRDWTI